MLIANVHYFEAKKLYTLCKWQVRKYVMKHGSAARKEKQLLALNIMYSVYSEVYIIYLELYIPQHDNQHEHSIILMW